MRTEPLRPWTIRSSTYRVDEKFLRLRSDTVELPDGTVVENYYVRESRGFAIMVAVTPAREIVLVRQYKHGAGEIMLELPAGTIDPGEEPASCAIRELAEETGYAGEPPELLHKLFADPTNSTGRFYLYLIENATKQFEQSLDVTEDITVETATIDDFHRMLRDGSIGAGNQIAAGYIALDRLSHA